MKRLRVYRTSWGTWAAEGGDYYCEFATFAEAVSEAHAVWSAVEFPGSAVSA